MKAPTNLSHRPIVTLNDYDKIDGKYIGCDARALSIGFSTWDKEGISAKIFRYVTTERGGSKWSRMSEELPLNRLLDLVILLVLCYQNFNDKKEGLFKPEEIIDEFPVHQYDQNLIVEISKWWRDVYGNLAPYEKDIKLFKDELENELNEGFLKERFKVLHQLLNKNEFLFKD